MEYSYKIEAIDCANYIMAYNEAIKLYEKMKVFGAILVGSLGLFQVLKSIQQGYYKMAMINALIYIVAVILFCVFVKSNSFYHESNLQSGEKYLKKHSNFLYEQKVKLEDDGVLYKFNNTTKKFGFNDINKVYLKNNTILAFGKKNVLLFMIPTHVFASENEKYKFIDYLKNNSKFKDFYFQ